MSDHSAQVAQPYQCGSWMIRQDNLHGDKKQSKGKRVIKHNPKISEPVLGFPSTGHMFANADSTLTAISAQY